MVSGMLPEGSWTVLQGAPFVEPSRMYWPSCRRASSSRNAFMATAVMTGRIKKSARRRRED